MASKKKKKKKVLQDEPVEPGTISVLEEEPTPEPLTVEPLPIEAPPVAHDEPFEGVDYIQLTEEDILDMYPNMRRRLPEDPPPVAHDEPKKRLSGDQLSAQLRQERREKRLKEKGY